MMDKLNLLATIYKQELAEANDTLNKGMERLMKKNFKESGRTLEEELATRCQDTKKKAK